MFREIRIPQWRRTGGDAASILRAYLPRPTGQQVGTPAAALHEAARLELHALPLTLLFLHLYRQNGVLPGSLPRQSAFRAFRVEREPPRLLEDLAAHLRQAERLGAEPIPMSAPAIKDYVLRRHRRVAKPDAPWVSEDWITLRHGLTPRQAPGVHSYRLSAIFRLAKDVGEV